MYKIAIFNHCLEEIQLLETRIKANSICPENLLFQTYVSEADLICAVPEGFDLIFLEFVQNESTVMNTAVMIHSLNPELLLVFYGQETEYMTKMFLVQPFRYLGKSYHHSKYNHELNEILNDMIQRKNIPCIITVQDGKMFKIHIDQIMYLSNFHRMVRLWITEKEARRLKSARDKDELVITCKMKLADFYKKLARYDFEYAHNSYIVNFNYIIRVSGNYLKLDNQIELNISRSKREVFDRRFSNYIGIKYRRER